MQFLINLLIVFSLGEREVYFARGRSVFCSFFEERHVKKVITIKYSRRHRKLSRTIAHSQRYGNKMKAE